MNLQAKVNILGLSERTLRRDFEKTGITLNANIQVVRTSAWYDLRLICIMYMQVDVLDQAATVHPNSWWWVKADGVDLVPGLGESMKMEWSGDVDLNDGSLQEQYKAYIQRLDFINSLGLDERQSQCQLLQDLHTFFSC